MTQQRAYQVRAACGRRIGMCGYTSVPKMDVLDYLCIKQLICFVCRFADRFLHRMHLYTSQSYPIRERGSRCEAHVLQLDLLVHRSLHGAR